MVRVYQGQCNLFAVLQLNYGWRVKSQRSLMTVWRRNQEHVQYKKIRNSPKGLLILVLGSGKSDRVNFQVRIRACLLDLELHLIQLSFHVHFVSQQHLFSIPRAVDDKAE